nr:hypothetical protein CFP56_60208 [Quercus suber]
MFYSIVESARRITKEFLVRPHATLKVATRSVVSEAVLKVDASPQSKHHSREMPALLYVCDSYYVLQYLDANVSGSGNVVTTRIAFTRRCGRVVGSKDDEDLRTAFSYFVPATAHGRGSRLSKIVSSVESAVIVFWQSNQYTLLNLHAACSKATHKLSIRLEHYPLAYLSTTTTIWDRVSPLVTGIGRLPDLDNNMASEIYVVSPATVPDAPGMVAANKAAFASNPTTALLFPKHLEHLTPADQFHAWRVKKFGDMIANGEIFMKATPATQPNVVAGIAQWQRPGYFAKKENQRSALLDEDGRRKDDTPACIDSDVLKEFSTSLNTVREEIWGDNHDFWCMAKKHLTFATRNSDKTIDLALLAVHPDHQGKGVASKLLQHGIGLADQEGAPIYVVASEQGTPVYRKRGFEARSEPTQFRGQETYVAMVKDARPESVGNME